MKIAQIGQKYPCMVGYYRAYAEIDFSILIKDQNHAKIMPRHIKNMFAEIFLKTMHF